MLLWGRWQSGVQRLLAKKWQLFPMPRGERACVYSTRLCTLHAFRKYTFEWLSRFHLWCVAVFFFLTIPPFCNFHDLLPLTSISLLSFPRLYIQGWLLCMSPFPWGMRETHMETCNKAVEVCCKKKKPTSYKGNATLCPHGARCWDKAMGNSRWGLG